MWKKEYTSTIVKNGRINALSQTLNVNEQQIYFHKIEMWKNIIYSSTNVKDGRKIYLQQK